FGEDGNDSLTSPKAGSSPLIPRLMGNSMPWERVGVRGGKKVLSAEPGPEFLTIPRERAGVRGGEPMRNRFIVNNVLTSEDCLSRRGLIHHLEIHISGHRYLIRPAYYLYELF
ncbi:MAG: hypothetical protein JXR86_21185, partial [Spirochaetales bacterium]|nr:hypothetical protein [Spirochaetales bacterium]